LFSDIAMKLKIIVKSFILIIAARLSLTSIIIYSWTIKESLKQITIITANVQVNHAVLFVDID